MDDTVTDIIEAKFVDIRGNKIPLINANNQNEIVRLFEENYFTHAVVVGTLFNNKEFKSKISPIYTHNPIGPDVINRVNEPKKNFTETFPIEGFNRIVGVRQKEFDIKEIDANAYFLLYSLDKSTPSIIAMSFSALLSRSIHPDGHLGRIITFLEN